LGIINIDFYVTDQLVIRYSAFGKNWRKNRNTMGIYTEIYRPLESQQFGCDICFTWVCYFIWNLTMGPIFLFALTAHHKLRGLSPWV